MPVRSPDLTRTPLSGGILAGGEGRRFGGADKGWLDVRDLSFIERVRERLVPQVDDLMISANRNIPRYEKLGHAVLCDRLGAGPLAGLLRLLESARHEWLVTVPCDALELPLDLAAQLRDVQRSSGADIVVLADDDGVHPTITLTRCALWPDLERFLLEGGRAGRAWQARHQLAQLRRPGVLVNVNDAQALAALEECADG